MTAPSIIDEGSDDGAYADALRFPPFGQITDDTWTNGFVPDRGKGALTARPAISFAPSHDTSDSEGAQ